MGATGRSDDDGNDVPITGDALATASQVALDHVGEGRVTATEEGDEDSYYEVEVRLDNGDEIDVQLDRDFNVVGFRDRRTRRRLTPFAAISSEGSPRSGRRHRCPLRRV